MSLGLNPAVVRWEARYADGSVLIEGQPTPDGPATYSRLPRRQLTSFGYSVAGGGEIARLERPLGAVGGHLVARRSTIRALASGVERVIFLFGWTPHGPAAAIDCAAGTAYADRAGFHPIGCEGRCGQPAIVCAALQEPVPHPHEGEIPWK